jgi:hypothetical protein
MLPFWAHTKEKYTPSKGERTHKWDVRGSDWSRVFKGDSLVSEEFSCGGIEGLSLSFYPQGSSGDTGGHAKVVLKARKLLKLTEKAVPEMWSGANELAYTVQILKYLHMGEGKGYQITVSDGKTFTMILMPTNPDIHALIQEKEVCAHTNCICVKGEGLVNSICSIKVKSSPHSENPGQKVLFLQTLKILQEGVEKIGEPVEFESENQAKKDTTTPKQVCSVSLSFQGYIFCLSSAEDATFLGNIF